MKYTPYLQHDHRVAGPVLSIFCARWPRSHRREICHRHGERIHCHSRTGAQQAEQLPSPHAHPRVHNINLDPPKERAVAELYRATHMAGDPKRVREEIEGRATATQADEVMVSPLTYHPADRQAA
jgi:alkanesulfonate monooxygenase SsuD/methylene tetrahydromethanopterin reductase-like flavin-dependent oxidoreductase (luciferase family)